MTPIFKSGDRSDPANYRPISIVSILCKPLENHIKKHILAHFDQFKLFHPCQSGFRPKHSCHTSLTSLVDKWLSNMNNNELTGVLIVDFAKAFDLIDHSLLLRKLEQYGLSKDTITLMGSFLFNRKQIVTLNGSVSSSLPTKYGIPQSWVLGPILFTIYTNDLPLALSSLSALFADDTTLHTSHKHYDQVTHTIQKSADELVEWSEFNHMSLHPKKTKSMLIATRQKRQNLPSNPQTLQINGNNIEEVNSHKVLGVVIDNNLSWSEHVSKICKSISKKVYQLSKIKHFLDLHTRKIFFHSFIESHINYASTIWDGASADILRPFTDEP